MTTEEKAKAYARELKVSKAIPGVMIPLIADMVEAAYLAGATEALASQWRSVEEELPPGTLVALCQSRIGEDNAIALCVYIKNRFMIYDRTFKYDREFYPTHWMPIPSLPDTNTEKE